MNLFRVAATVSSFAFQTSEAFAQEDIYDIRGPISIPSPWLWVLYAAAGLGAILLGLWLWKSLRKKKPLPPPPFPYEIALRQAASLLGDAEKAKEFSIQISEAVRLYLEFRFHLKTVRSTTEEFLHGLLERKPMELEPFMAPLEDFLRHCDLAKFARHPLTTDDMQSMFQSAEALINQTRPPSRSPSNTVPTSAQRAAINPASPAIATK
jgi:hypothetical protein